MWVTASAWRQDRAIHETTFRTASSRSLALPAAFAAFAAVVAVLAPDTPTRLTCLAIAAGAVAWVVRTARAGVELRDAHLVVRGTFRTRAYPWERVERALVVPFRGRTTLALRFTDGRERRIEQLAARGQDAGIVLAAASAISRRTGTADAWPADA